MWPNAIQAGAQTRLAKWLNSNDDGVIDVIEMLRSIPKEAQVFRPHLERLAEGTRVRMYTNIFLDWPLDRQRMDARVSLASRSLLAEWDSDCGPAFKSALGNAFKSSDKRLWIFAFDVVRTQIKGPELQRELLVDLLGADRHVIRLYASRQLAELPMRAKVVAQILQHLERESCPHPEYAAYALGCIGPEAKDAVVSLRGRIGSSNLELSRQSCFALGRIGT